MSSTNHYILSLFNDPHQIYKLLSTASWDNIALHHELFNPFDMAFEFEYTLLKFVDLPVDCDNSFLRCELFDLHFLSAAADERVKKCMWRVHDRCCCHSRRNTSHALEIMPWGA